MGASQRAKGARGERELVNALRSVGIDAARVSPLEAGGVAFGDVRDEEGNTWQVKRRKAINVYGWLVGCDRLAMRADAKSWLVVLPLADYAALVNAAREVIDDASDAQDPVR